MRASSSESNMPVPCSLTGRDIGQFLRPRKSAQMGFSSADDKVYPLNTALEVMDNLQSLNTRSSSLDDARDYIKALAPWVKDDQVVYGDEDEPIGVSGAHTPFPPFHWRCRTETIVFL